VTDTARLFDDLTPLGARLRQQRVTVRAADPETVVLRNVPANAHYFNKARTNLIVKRAREGMPYLIGVDEDLKYTGQDETLAKAFAGGTTQQGWRVVFVDRRPRADFPEVVEAALQAVGFEGVEPAWSPRVSQEPPGAAGLLARFGVELSGLDGTGRPVKTVGRTEELAEIVSALLQLQPRLPLISGSPGVGKSHLLSAVARGLQAHGGGWRVTRVDLGRFFTGTLLEAERENLLAAALDEAAADPHRVLALERLDLAISETRHGPLSLAHAIEAGRRIVGTTLPMFEALADRPPLSRHMQTVRLAPLGMADTCHVVGAALPRLAAHHGVRIDEALVQEVVARAGALTGQLPGSALALMDAACARARVSGAPQVDLLHACIAASAFGSIEEQGS
jgi:ATP-dependent Clp protease ATP-binding subunit ClpA